jgi:hypothetical protein
MSHVDLTLRGVLVAVASWSRLLLTLAFYVLLAVNGLGWGGRPLNVGDSFRLPRFFSIFIPNPLNFWGVGNHIIGLTRLVQTLFLMSIHHHRRSQSGFPECLRRAFSFSAARSFALLDNGC